MLINLTISFMKRKFNCLLKKNVPKWNYFIFGYLLKVCYIFLLQKKCFKITKRNVKHTEYS